MARFKIEIPDSKLEFILDLFNSFSFLKYEAIDPEPNWPETGNSKTEEHKQTEQEAESDRLAHLSDLRNTIDSIQHTRENLAAESQSILFRFPHGTEMGAIKVNNLHDLITTIEHYYRVNAKDLSFKANNSSEGYEMDKYQVFISLEDNSEISAGYCNKKLK
ncbi:hypothetical protein [Carboxylicivirga sp. RSCT41]|uniref:hypothetical protein n=1 Tax=Carboxylicivirga agarovorans TaxID=3417570 RepID=UPI003D32FF0E